MKADALESWQKWLLGIVTAMIMTGIPTIIGFVLSIHDTVEKMDGRVVLTTYRVQRLEESEAAIRPWRQSIDATVLEHTKQLTEFSVRLDHVYVARVGR